jgi:hypothetical protein
MGIFSKTRHYAALGQRIVKLRHHKGELTVGIGIFTTTALAAWMTLTGGLVGLSPSGETMGLSEGGSLAKQATTITQATAPRQNSAAQRFVGCSARLTANNPSSVINYRTIPSVLGQLLGSRRVGDRLTILNTYLAPDGYTWYGARFDGASNAQGWVRGDLVTLQSDCFAPQTQQEPNRRERSPQPDAAAIETSVSTASQTASGSSEDDRQPQPVVASSQAPTTERGAISFNQPQPAFSSRVQPTTFIQPFDSREINYFLEVALGSELGNSAATIRRWEDDICIHLNFPSQENISPQAERAVRATVEDVVDDINDNFDALATLVERAGGNRSWSPIEVAIAGETCTSPNIELYYVQAENFSRYDPNVRRGQVGHVWTWWDQNEINRARILISSNYLNANERDHVIREEITQSLGILKDSWEYPDSIFYQGWTSVTDYAPIDEAVIQMLYHPAIEPGLESRQARQQLSSL